MILFLLLYGGHSVHVAVAEFHDSVIKLSCLSDISDLFEKCNQVRVADVFVDSVFIMVYNQGLS